MYILILVSSPSHQSVHRASFLGGELELARSEEKGLSDQRGHWKSRRRRCRDRFHRWFQWGKTSENVGKFRGEKGEPSAFLSRKIVMSSFWIHQNHQKNKKC